MLDIVQENGIKLSGCNNRRVSGIHPFMAKREEIGGRLARRREEKKLTLQAAADAIGVPKSTYSHWEKGKLPDPETLDKLVEFLEVSYDWLFTGQLYETQPEAGVSREEEELLRAWRLVKEKRPQTALDIHQMLMLSYTALLRGQ